MLRPLLAETLPRYWFDWALTTRPRGLAPPRSGHYAGDDKTQKKLPVR